MNVMRIIDGERFGTAPGGTAQDAAKDAEAGFTLIEIMVSAFIFTIIFSALYVVLNVGRNSWQTGSADIAAQSAARRGMRTMARELRQTTADQTSGVTANGGPYTSITFNLPAGVSGGSITWSAASVQYSLDSGDVNTDGVTDQVIRVYGTEKTVVANDVSALIFRRQAATPDLLEIEMRIQTQTPAGGLRNVTTKTQVMFRN